jgi:hypothetical protein
MSILHGGAKGSVADADPDAASRCSHGIAPASGDASRGEHRDRERKVRIDA